MAELRPIETVDLKLLKVAAKLLNDSSLLENKLKIVVKKGELVDSFTNAVKALDAAGKEAEIPQEVVDAFNHCYTAPTPEELEAAKKKGTGKPAPDPEKAKLQAAKREASKARKNMLISMIREGKYTRKQIVAAAVEAFPQIAKSTITTEMTDSKNPKYFKQAGFPARVVANKEGILSFSGKVEEPQEQPNTQEPQEEPESRLQNEQ